MTKAQILKNVAEILRGIAEECKVMSRYAMTQHGINDKIGSDTLTDSNLYNSINVKSNGYGLITILVDGYIDYVQRGRKPRAYDEDGKRSFPWVVALEVLGEWCQRKGLPSDNTTIYFIRKSIIEKGIRPRPIFETFDGLWTNPLNGNDVVMEDLSDKYWDDWADELFEAITEGIDYEFQNNKE